MISSAHTYALCVHTAVADWLLGSLLLYIANTPVFTFALHWQWSLWVTLTHNTGNQWDLAAWEGREGCVCLGVGVGGEGAQFSGKKKRGSVNWQRLEKEEKKNHHDLRWSVISRLRDALSLVARHWQEGTDPTPVSRWRFCVCQK